MNRETRPPGGGKCSMRVFGGRAYPSQVSDERMCRETLGSVADAELTGFECSKSWQCAIDERTAPETVEWAPAA